MDSNALVTATESALHSSKSVTLAATAEVWYLRLGHLHERTLTTMAKTGQIEIRGSHHLADCITCRRALAKKVYRRLPTTRPTQVYTMVHVDVVTVREAAYNKCKYYTLFTEARALYRHEYPSQFKGQAAIHMRDHRRLIQTQTGLEIPVYVIDGGKEYGGNKLTEFANDSGVQLRITAPYSSTQNGRGEVSNHIVNTLTRKLMIQARLPTKYWPYALRTATMLLNVTISPTLGHSPHEIVASQVGTQEVLPRLDHLRAYGCSTVIYDHDVAKASKFQATGIHGRLVGYEGHAVYQVYVPSLHKVIRTKDAEFFEGNSPLDPDEDEDTPYDDVFPIQSTVKESDTSGGDETRVTFTNEPVMIPPSLYVEDEDAPDTELVQEIHDAAEDGDLEDLLPGIQPQTDIPTTEDHDEEAASVPDTSTDKPRNRALRR